MSNKDDFYIGWEPKMAQTSKRPVTLAIGLVALVVIGLTFGVVHYQKPFNDHAFEYGSLTTIEGTYYDHPIPMVVADTNQLPLAYSPNILLVGYGKFGAKGIMESYASDIGNMNGAKITIQGTLIFGDGRTLLELTQKEKSILQVEQGPVVSKTSHILSESEIYIGEILDPKCYFGVMKPGEGKIHKSCAIRCISGGIPPVLRVKDDYYIFLVLMDRLLIGKFYRMWEKPLKFQLVRRTIMGGSFYM